MFFFHSTSVMIKASVLEEARKAFGTDEDIVFVSISFILNFSIILRKLETFSLSCFPFLSDKDWGEGWKEQANKLRKLLRIITHYLHFLGFKSTMFYFCIYYFFIVLSFCCPLRLILTDQALHTLTCIIILPKDYQF